MGLAAQQLCALCSEVVETMNGDVANEAPVSSTPQGAPSPSLEDVDSKMYDSVDSSMSTSKYTSENYRRAVGASYVLTMGVSGIVLVALASSLRDLASAIDKTSVEVSGNDLSVMPVVPQHMSPQSVCRYSPCRCLQQHQ